MHVYRPALSQGCYFQVSFCLYRTYCKRLCEGAPFFTLAPANHGFIAWVAQVGLGHVPLGVFRYMHMFLVLGIYLCQRGISFLGAVSADRVYYYLLLKQLAERSLNREEDGRGTESRRHLAMHTCVVGRATKARRSFLRFTFTCTCTLRYFSEVGPG